jgi:hypothetical protein
MATTPKTIPLKATITTIAAPAPAAPEIETPATTEPVAAVTVAAPVEIYDRDNLDHVLQRLRLLHANVQCVSADIADHFQKHSRTHVNGGGSAGPLEAPVAYDPAMAGRLHALQASIGEFVHSVGSRL